MRSFITGINGFMGWWLTAALRDVRDEVFGLSQTQQGRKDHVTYKRGDITDARQMDRIIKAIKPHRIFHLAAQSNIPRSFEHPQETIAINVNGSINLFEAARRHTPEATIISVGSSAEYGLAAKHSRVLTEDLHLAPTSPYGISKVSQGMTSLLYTRAYRMRMIHVRPFAIIGPRKQGDALTDFCQGVVAIEQGNTDSLHVGNLDAVRDFVDIRDCVQALILLSRRGEAGETYNICNGKGVSLQHIITLLQKSALVPFRAIPRMKKPRPIDDPRIVGSNRKLESLGYTQSFPIQQTVQETLDYWRTDIEL